jgi:hypothetical protein
MSNALTFRPNPSDLAKLKAELNQFAIATQDAIVRRAARKFAKEEIARLTPGNARTLPPRDAKHKIKIFKSGVVWIAVGYKAGRGDFGLLQGRVRRKAYDAEGTGWRSHFTELGFHSWAKGMYHERVDPSFVLMTDEQRKAQRKGFAKGRGKGWKRGLRHRGRGVYHRGTRASELTHAVMAPRLIGYLQDELRSEISKRSKPRKVA